MKKKLLMALVLLLLLGGCLPLPVEEVAYKKEKYDKVVELYEKDPEKFPEKSLGILAASYEALGEKEKALSIYESWISKRDIPREAEGTDRDLYERYLALKDLEPREEEKSLTPPSPAPLPETQGEPRTLPDPEPTPSFEKSPGLTVYVNDVAVYHTDEPTEHLGGFMVPVGKILEPLNLYMYHPDSQSVKAPGTVPDIEGLPICFTPTPGSIDPLLGIYLGGDYGEIPPREESEEFMEGITLRTPPVVIEGDIYLDSRDVNDYIITPFGGRFVPGEGEVRYYSPVNDNVYP